MSEDQIFVGMGLPEVSASIDAEAMVAATDGEAEFLSSEFQAYVQRGHEFFNGFDPSRVETLADDVAALIKDATAMSKRLRAQSKKHDLSPLNLAEDQMAELIAESEVYRAKLLDLAEWLHPELSFEEIIADGSPFRAAWSRQNTGRADSYLEMLNVRKAELAQD